MDGMRETVAHAQAGVTDFQENMEALKHNFFVRGYFKNRGYEDSAELAKDEIQACPRVRPRKPLRSRPSNSLARSIQPS